jgi:hypothetical protein
MVAQCGERQGSGRRDERRVEETAKRRNSKKAARLNSKKGGPSPGRLGLQEPDAAQNLNRAVKP